MLARATRFLEQCKEAGDVLVLPTVVLAELLAGLPPEEHGTFVQAINERFVVAPFDGRAALVFGRLWHAHKETLIPLVRAEETGVTRSIVKADHMIVATAVAASCDGIYTDDNPLGRFCEGRIQVHKIADIVIPPDQMSLSLSE